MEKENVSESTSEDLLQIISSDDDTFMDFVINYDTNKLSRADIKIIEKELTHRGLLE